MFMRHVRRVGQPFTHRQKSAFSMLFVNGKSFIKLSTDFPTLGAIMKAELLKQTPFISNNFDNYPKNWQFSSKVLGTRIRMNLSDKQLRLDPLLFKQHPAIQQVAVNASTVTSTGQSRIIIDSPCEPDTDTVAPNDPYHTFKLNVDAAENMFRTLANCQVSFLIDRDNYAVPQLKKLLQHKRKSIDFNIIDRANDEKVLLDTLFDEAYKLEHVYLRSYVRNPATLQFSEVKDLASTQVTLSEVVSILKINHFKGSLVLPFSAQHSMNNLQVAKHVLRQHQYTQQSEAQLQDNWIVF